MDSTIILRHLKDGLTLRQATAADADRLVAFNADTFREFDQEEPFDPGSVWTRDLIERPHPTFGDGGFTVVEDPSTGKIVSSLCLIPQTWSYGDIQFGVGRPELVRTHPDYRRRGLVRAQFDVIHGWSAKLGHQVQAITGIPYFYRQFGYEMGLTLGGGRRGYKSSIPKLKDDEPEPFTIRQAEGADLAFIAGVYDAARVRYLVTCVRDDAQWHYELGGRSRESTEWAEFRIVTTTEGEPVGVLAHPAKLWGNQLGLFFYELKPGVSWLAVTPSVLRYMQTTGEAYAAKAKKEPAFEQFGFGLGPEHPAYGPIRSRLPHEEKPYAWFVRVGDLPGFLRHIAPVLERRLAGSPLVGHTGELKIGFYRGGLRMAFEARRRTRRRPTRRRVPRPDVSAVAVRLPRAGGAGLRLCRLLDEERRDAGTVERIVPQRTVPRVGGKLSLCTCSETTLWFLDDSAPDLFAKVRNKR